MHRIYQNVIDSLLFVLLPPPVPTAAVQKRLLHHVRLLCVRLHHVQGRQYIEVATTGEPKMTG